MSMKRMKNAGLGLALGALLFGGGAMAQDKTSDQPNLDKQSGDQTSEQEDARETGVQKEGVPKLAQECRDLAVQKDEQSEEIDGKSIYETNAKNYKQGEEFELLVDLLGAGNAKYNLTCKIDADGNMSYEGMEKSSTVKSSPGGA